MPRADLHRRVRPHDGRAGVFTPLVARSRPNDRRAAHSGGGSGAGSGAEAGNGGGGSAPLPQVDALRSALARVPGSAVPSAALHAAVAANSAFAVELYAQVLKQQTSGNLLTSPISASLALTRAYAGARGQTASEMASALHLDSSSPEAIFAGQDALTEALDCRAADALTQAGSYPGAKPVSADYQFQVLSSIWGEQSYPWEPAFLDTLATSYGTGIYAQNFLSAPERARATINEWIDGHTNHQIAGLVPPGAINDATRIVLVNALYLNLPWAVPFSFRATSPGQFTGADSHSISAPFMHDTSNRSYFDDGQAQIVALPLSSFTLSIVVKLPHEGVTLADYEAKLTAGSAALSTPQSSALVALSLPKTKFTTPSFSLSGALQSLGMKQAFDGAQADFSGMCSHPPDGGHILIGDVRQKAMLSMQEAAVEAAAVTVVIGARTGVAGAGPVEEPTPIPMIVNRPYLVALVDNPTGALLMLGHIVDPSDPGSP